MFCLDLFFTELQRILKPDRLFLRYFSDSLKAKLKVEYSAKGLLFKGKVLWGNIKREGLLVCKYPQIRGLKC